MHQQERVTVCAKTRYIGRYFHNGVPRFTSEIHPAEDECGSCCKRRTLHGNQLYIGFRSVSQTSAQLEDIQVASKAESGNACDGTSMGTDSYGCADASREVVFGGEAFHCLGDCAKRSLEDSVAEMECSGEILADVVFYDVKAYEADPDEDRMKELVAKIDLDEPLSPAELQDLEVVRRPDADHIATEAANGGKTGSEEVQSEAQDASSENATS